MGLRMSPRIPIQKTDLQDFFRRSNPATRKSSPNLVGTYIRRAGKPHSKPAQLTKIALAALVSILAALAAVLPSFQALRCDF